VSAGEPEEGGAGAEAHDRRKQVLVLTRREGDTIMIGDEISVRVEAIERRQVKICIEAPPEVAVHRLEVWNRLRQGERLRRRRAGAGG
jgi:carbon storage regulator